MEIGLGITTYKRAELLSNILPIWIKRSPKSTKIAINIDGDYTDYKGLIDQYPNVEWIYTGARRGIAAGKNNCMDALSECEHIFMADDDIYPKTEDWYENFVEAKPIHSCYITQKHGGNHVRYRGGDWISFTGCGGVLLYFRGDARHERYNEDLGIYGFEHVEITERIWRKYQAFSPTAYMAPKFLDGKFYTIDFSWGSEKEKPEFEFDENLIHTSMKGEDAMEHVRFAAKVKQEIDRKLGLI